MNDMRAQLAAFIVSLEELDIDRDSLDELLASFLESSEILSRELEAAVQQNDSRLTRTAAHGLKGCIANFGFTELADLAAELETSGKAAKWEETKATLAAFLPKCQQARETVAEARRNGTK